jgi:hypothetical protein
LVLLALGEGAIGRAVALEAARHPAREPEMFSRGTQQAGGVVAALLYGAALGTVLAVAFAVVRRRLGPGDDWRRSLRLAACAFLTVSFVPFLKYPANPPGVGDPATIGRRTILYMTMVGWSLLSTWAGWRAWRWLAARSAPDHLRLPAVALAYLVVVLAGVLALPAAADDVSAPATLVWRFRLASATGAAAFWAVAGATFGWLRLAGLGRRPFAPVRQLVTGRTP